METPVTPLEREAEVLRPAPVMQAERIASLDVLRGFALLGILILNIQSFAMPMAAYFNPTVWGDLTGANFVVWLLSHLLADQKFMTIFSMLFGAGIVLFSARATAGGRSAVRLHYRRSFWLLLFGAAHAYLLWYGDILFLYALCALILYPFARLRPRWLLVAGVLLLAVSSLFNVFFGWSLPHWPEESRTEMIDQKWDPIPEVKEAEIAAYRGGWREQMAHRAPTAFEFQTMGVLVWGFWRAGGLMLVGMALYKFGVFSAGCSAGFYAALVAGAILAGLPLAAYGVYWNFAEEWGLESMFYGTQFNYWGSLLVSLGWVGLVMRFCQRSALPWLKHRLAAVGQMAFSNYILQTVICTTIFYGHGWGWFAQVERTGQISVVFGVWIVQLLLSPFWLAHFRFGPLEWLWRCLTYGRLQPLRRGAAGQGVLPV